MQQLHEKSGSTTRRADFAKAMRRTVDANKLPEYHLRRYDGDRGEECVHMVRRTYLAQDHPERDRNLIHERGKPKTRPRRSP